MRANESEVKAEQPFAETFAAQLRRFRLRAGLSQEALAERAGLTEAAIGALEQGLRRHPYPHTVGALADALELADDERASLAIIANRTRRGGAQTSIVALPSPRATPTNLPASLSKCIGREHDQVAVRARLSTTRLVTLTGTGGVGKTRLALDVAAAVLPEYADGVWWVELGALEAGPLVPQAIATALRIRERPGESVLATLFTDLRTRQILLVLDNCEHLIDHVAEIAVQLLRACSRLQILATSRERLAVEGEVAWRVPSLAVPPPNSTLATSEQSAAVQLFVEHAAATQPGFELNAANGAAVAELCRRLDGIPLALELAAARTLALTPAQLVERLGDRFRLLTAGRRSAPPRQQTLRATVDWSYGLLSETEQLALRRLAIFAGGCTLEAVETVCSGTDLPAGSLPAVLGQLVDKSLLTAELHDGSLRYRLLDTIRQYAYERLQAAGEDDDLASRHRDWCLQLAEKVEPEWVDPTHVARLDREQDNLRAALRRAIERKDASAGLRLAISGGQPMWYLRGRYAEGRAWLTALLALTDTGVQPELVAAGLVWAGQLAYCEGDTAAAMDLLYRGRAQAAQVSDTRTVANAEQIFGNVKRMQADLMGAKQHYTRACALARQAGRLSTESWVLIALAITCMEQGDYSGTRTFISELTEVIKVRDNPVARSRMDVLHARLTSLDGDQAAAEALFERCLARIAELGDPQGLAFARWLAAYSALERRDWTGAARHLAEMLEVARSTHDQTALARALDAVGELLAGHADFEHALRLAGTAQALRQKNDIRTLPIEASRLDGWLARARRELGVAVDNALAAGRWTPAEVAVDDASIACGRFDEPRGQG